jgi:hypothetical protein
MREEEDAERTIELLRLSFELAERQQAHLRERASADAAA